MESRTSAGFTMIELVVVIVLLGLLAAVALPRFADLSSEARAATLNGVRGSFTAGVHIAHAKWLAGGTGTAGTVNLDGDTVVVNVQGWPTVDPDNATQDTAAELYQKLMAGPLPASWQTTETPADEAGLASFTLPGNGGGAFSYNAANGQVL